MKWLTVGLYASLGPITGLFAYYTIKYIRAKRYAMASICIMAIIEALAILAGVEDLMVVQSIKHMH